MAEVTVQFKDDFGCILENDQKEILDNFIEKYKKEIPSLCDMFYVEEDDELFVLHTLEDHYLSTRDRDELSTTLINLLSTVSESSDNFPDFGLGGTNLSKEFFKELYSICDDICFSVTVSVVGQSGYYDVTFEITEKGWNIPYCDFYEEDENDEW